jgi:RNA polymerase sigma factor (sigma-70 family)
MTSDLDLLEQFARENSQAAFTTLVRRHVNLVYSAALRQVRTAQLAEEIAQSVFTDLARDAGKLNSETILTAWLYAVTRRTAIDVIRKESRRQLREQIAMEMQNMNATENSWRQIEPLLDDAMAALDETDRAAILLRYFENKNLREVGEHLQISDDAAQKRVSRAVEKLREFFSKRKITIGASGLAVLISANAVQAAPVGLAATISAVAVLAGTAVQTSTLITATKAIAMTTLQKTLVTVAFAAAVGTGIFEAQQNSQLREKNQNLQQQQNSLNDQLAQLQREHDDSTNQIAGLLAENERLESGLNENELLKLRGEVTRLQNAEMQKQIDPIANAADNWVKRAEQFQQYVASHPEDEIPEFQFLTGQDWLHIVEFIHGEPDFSQHMTQLKWDAVGEFIKTVQTGLQKYIQANNGQFPADLSDLQPYCDPNVEAILQQRYEIKPANTVPPNYVQDSTTFPSDWIIVMKQPLESEMRGRFAFWLNGSTILPTTH